MVETTTNDGGVTVQGERFSVEFNAAAAAVMGDASRVLDRETPAPGAMARR